MVTQDYKDNKCNPVHGVTDEERSLFSNILNAAAIAAAGYNAYKALDIATQEWEMAMKYWRIAEDWLDYYKGFYAPVEDQELKEATELEQTEPEYNIARGQARTSAWLEFRNKLRPALRCTSRYCTGLRGDMLVRIMAAQAESVALADGLGYRNERAYVEARNDVRWSRRLETAKRGRDIAAEVPAMGMASAGIYGSLFDQAWQGLESAGMYLGYANNKHRTAYPTTYLAGQMQYAGRFNTAGAEKIDFQQSLKELVYD